MHLWCEFLRLYSEDSSASPSLYNRRTAAFWKANRPSSSWNGLRPLVYNVIRMAIDATLAKTTVQRPAVYISTEGAKLDMQLKAKGFQKVITTALEECDGHEQLQLVARDALLFGTGIVKVYDTENRSGEDRVTVERVDPFSIKVDMSNVKNGRTRAVYQMDLLSFEEIVALVPDVDKKTLRVSVEKNKVLTADGRKLCPINEGWSISLSNDNPGRHTIATPDTVLYDDREFMDDHPFCFLHYKAPVSGFWGIGIAQENYPTQLELMHVQNKIAVNLDALAVPFIWAEDGTIELVQLEDNTPARLITGTKPPQVITPPGIHPQVFQYQQQLKQEIIQSTGSNELEMTGQRPNSLSTGRAVSTYLAAANTKTGLFQKRFENLYEQAGRKIIKVLQSIAADNDGVYRVRHAFRRSMEELNLKDFNLEDSQFVLKVGTGSALSSAFAMKIQEITELLALNVIPRELALSLLNLPDLEKYADISADAIYEDLQRTFEHMLEKGEYLSPIETQATPLGISTCAGYLARGRVNGQDPERLLLLEQWLSEATEIVKQVQIEQAQLQVQIQLAAQPPAPPAPPTAVPEQAIAPLLKQ